METEIKQIHDGYKQTEIGEIPNEWEIKTIGDVFTLIGGMPISRSNTGNGTALYLHYGDIHKSSKVIFNTKNAPCTTIDLTTIKLKQDALLKTGDIVFADASEDYDDIGKNVVVEVEEGDLFVSGLHTIVAREKDISMNSTYKSFAFKTHEVRKQLSLLANGSTVLGISKTNLAKVKFLVPTLQEQQKIAEILSTADKQIEKTEQLIQKTKELKKGLMQQLLTKGIGHTEFKETELGEIPVDWDVVFLDEVSIRKSGHTPNKKILEYWNGDIPWISLKDTFRLDNRYIDNTTDYTNEEGIKNSSAVLLPENTVVLLRDASVGKVGITSRKMCTSQHFMNYVETEKLSSLFLYYTFLNRKKEFERIAIGSTIKTIGLSYFKQLKICLPPIEEQQKIAEILSTVDEQIKSYEKEKEKQIELKKGLMQQLLTGKLRVTV